MAELVSIDTDTTTKVATLTLNRPKMNALDFEMQQHIEQAAIEVGRNDGVHAVVLTGGERVFAAGADIKQMAQQSYADMVTRAAALQHTFSVVAQIPKPVVAAVAGYALGGGCELTLCADVRFAAQDATFGQPEILLGLIPGAGGTQRLARLIGPARAKDLIFSGRFVTADEALAIGLADRVLPPDELHSAAHEWAAQFRDAATVALRAAKQCVDTGLGLDLRSGLELETAQFAAMFATQDARTGMQSFLDNGPGKATFEGR